MVSTKFMFLVSLCFIGLQVSNTATINPCTAAADCAATQKCIPLPGGTDTVCVEVCTTDADCGGAHCAPATDPDIDSKTDFNTCPLLGGLGCSSDADCTTDPAAPACNPFMLGCAPNTAIATTIAATTIGSTSTTTVPPCADKVVGGSNDCIAMAPYCTNSLYLSLMKDKCPKTCGYCTTSSGSSGSSGSGSTSSGCVDLIVGGSNDCVSMASYCTNTAYKTLMKEKCPKTCGYCSSTSSSSSSSGSTNTGTCKDNASDCSAKSHLCKNSLYLSLMKSTCPLTCGYC
uniref:ShKT domain-containing protein n=1 Tax=Strongyloides stercoralis TaxID=6248 RepID=A0AAF5D374_STRER